MKRIILIFCLFLVRLMALAQQDAQYSQYLFNGLYINPAYAGYKKDTYLNGTYRSQWVGFEGAPRSFSLSVDGSVDETKVGLGLLLNNDVIGAQSSLSVYADYAYRIQIGYDEDSRLAFGIGAGFIQNGIDGTKLNATQPGDTYVPTNYQKYIIPDAQLGVFYSSNSFFSGFSVDNIMSHWIADFKNVSSIVAVPVPHFYFTAGTMWNVNQEVMVKPSILLKDDRQGPTSLDLNTYVLLNEVFWIGGTYRTAVHLYAKPNLQSNLQQSNAIIAMAQFFVNENLRIGYSFDYSLSQLANYNYGTHEITIGIFLKQGRLKSIGEKCYY